MKNTTHIIEYILAGLMFIMLGGLAGWYVFVHRQVAATQATDTARGFNTAPSFGAATGSGYQNISNPSGANSGSSTVATGSTGNPAPRLWHVTGSPVAGMGFAASSTRLYFAERATGNILEADSRQTKVTRLTNTLFPKIYEALFVRDGSVILRSAPDTKTISTYAARLGTTTPDAPVTLQGVYLPQNIFAITARSAQQVFFLTEDGQGGSIGIMSDLKGSSQKKLFASALHGWSVRWLTDGNIYLTQNPSDGVTGFAFQLQIKGGLTSVIGNLPGLTFLPRSGSTARMYGTSSGGALSLYTQTKSTATPLLLPVKTVADKCVWAPGKELVAYCAVPQTIPDRPFLRTQYEGAAHTADTWWKVDASAGTATRLFAPDVQLSLDVENPMIDETGKYIAFMNAADKSLWVLTVEQ